MSERTAVVTLAIGDGFARRWREVCEGNWREYCDRHAYDLICITEPLDDSSRARDRSPSWQKLLILGQPFAGEYDRIVWVDSDVYFAPGAPEIAAGVPLEKVGAVDEWNQPTERVLNIMRQGSAEEYYGDYGLPGSFDQVVQAGVMVTSPLHHRDVFEHVYDFYEDKPGMFFEMRPLSYELLDRDLVHWMDPRFNVLWMAYKMHRHPFIRHFRRHPLTRGAVRNALEEVHFLHFAGEAEQMAFALGSGTASTHYASPHA